MRTHDSEKAWQAQVLQLARLYHWRYYHTFDSRRSVAGFPDLVLVRPPMLVLTELKSDRGVLTPEQRAWLEDLAGCTQVRADVWRPVDLERIVQQLAG